MNQSSHSATVQLANAIRRAWRWAALRLAALADDVAGLFRRRRRADAVLCLRDDGADLFAVNAGAAPLASVSGRLADVPRLMPRDMAKRLGTGATLRFSAAQAVNKRVVLPAEAADVIGAIIRNKVEGLAPWPLSQAVWGYRAAPVPGDSAHVAVDVGILSRKVMEDTLDSFARAGVSFIGVEIGAPGFTSQAIAIERDGDDTGKGFRRVAGVAMAALTLVSLGAGALGGTRLYQAQIEQDRLERRSGELAAELHHAGRAVSGSSFVAEANRLHDRKGVEPPAVVVLNALSELLPDSVWLTGFSFADGKVTLNGRGQNVPPLVGLLEASPLFKDVIFSSAVQRNPETGQDEFAMTATIEPDGGRP